MSISFKVMGVLNVTPNSFFDGGKYRLPDSAVRHACLMAEEGAEIIDIGGEATHPGAKPVSIQEEIDRVTPVIQRLSQEIGVCLSVDTSKPQVMKAAIQAGATMINDVQALTQPGALAVVALHQVPVCLMHRQGNPETMQVNPSYQNIIQEIMDFFQQRIEACLHAGLSRDKLILDPGFGFGKLTQHNMQLVAKLKIFTTLGFPILLGVSRKFSIGEILKCSPNQRLNGSIALAVLAFYHGCSIIRTHDVKATVEALTVTKQVLMELADGFI